MIDRDPWDPIPPATPERLKTADMCEDITARLLTSQRDDPPLYPQLVQRMLQELERITEDEDDRRDRLAVWARWLLEQFHTRAVTGVEWGEPQEPAWSLDSTARELPYERTLDADERGGR